MKYIETLREGERIQEVYLCKQKTSAMTKTGKEYENVILQDKTGQLDAKIWDPGSMGIDDFDALDYVEVNGDITVYNGQVQLSIKRARKVSQDSVNTANYLPCTDKNMDEIISSFEYPYFCSISYAICSARTPFNPAARATPSPLINTIWSLSLVNFLIAFNEASIIILPSSPSQLTILYHVNCTTSISLV